ncbi:MAG: helix-turn-helix transcriptional regulator [Clostridia bacterium]|nr:helix-turn-helix transcriptional regulator [Clostridia bacterium]
MSGLAEKPFTINGIESWVHCLNIDVKNIPKESISCNYHYHNYIEFLYALSPGACVWINGKSHKFNEGDFVIINSGELHTVTFNENANYICVKFSPQILYAYEQALYEFKYVMPFLFDNAHQKYFSKDELKNTNIHKLTIEIMQEWNKKEPAYELVLRANILRIFSEVFRFWHKNKSLISETALTDTLKKALVYIGENYSSTTEKEVAKHCNISYNHFSYSFKNLMGQSFNQYLTTIKIREAEKILVSSNKSITEIALDTGFSSASHFISRFKHYKHVTPKQFRDKNKKAFDL